MESELFTSSEKKRTAKNIFEERVVAIAAATPEEALAKGEREADEYAASIEIKRHPWLEAYEQDGDPLIDGYEVWSELYQSSDDLTAFVNNRYGTFEYYPDQ